MRLFYLLILVFLAAFCQGSLVTVFPFLWVNPDLVLLIVVFNAFLKGSREGALVGFFGGLFQDLATGSYIGMNALSLMAAGYLVGLTQSKLLRESSLIITFLVWLSSIAAQLISYILLASMEVYISPGVALLRVIIPTAIFTSILAPVFYPRFYKSCRKGMLRNRNI
ncbi:MAG: rod shape-determining protein MreD [Bacillota bacterium]